MSYTPIGQNTVNAGGINYNGSSPTISYLSWGDFFTAWGLGTLAIFGAVGVATLFFKEGTTRVKEDGTEPDDITNKLTANTNETDVSDKTGHAANESRVAGKTPLWQRQIEEILARAERRTYVDENLDDDYNGEETELYESRSENERGVRLRVYNTKEGSPEETTDSETDPIEAKVGDSDAETDSDAVDSDGDSGESEGE